MAYGYWDLVSVSNYCNPVWDADGLLSPLDVSGLSHLYGQGYAEDRLWYGIGNVRDYAGASNPEDGFLFKMINYDIDPGHTPLGGDFDGDGRDDIYYHKSGAGMVYYGNAAGNGFQVHSVTSASGSIRSVDDFDGDGRDDVLFHNPGSGANVVWFGNSNRTFTTVTVASMPGKYGHKGYAGDFDGDGRGDIYWIGEGSNGEQIWYGRSDRSFDQYYTYTPRATWASSGDFNGDNIDDLMAYYSGGSDYIYYGSSTRGPLSQVSVTLPDNGTAVTGDLDADGYSDVLWNFPGENDEIWLFDASLASYTMVPTSSTLGNSNGEAVPIIGDFDADGMDDVFWYSR